MNSISIDHLNFSVSNLEESIAWYKKLFGFEVVERGIYEGRPWGIVRSHDTMLCMYEYPNRRALDEANHPADGKIHRLNHFGVRIHDPEKWKALVEEHQLKLYWNSPVHWPHSTAWYVEDPSGNEIEVVYWNDDQIRF